MLAERLGSPVISMVWVGVPEKGFWSLTRNSPEGGGAIERGMLICVCVVGGVECSRIVFEKSMDRF